MKNLAYSIATAIGVLATINIAVAGMVRSIPVVLSIISLGVLLVLLWKN